MYNKFFEGLEKDYGMRKKEFEDAEFHYCGKQSDLSKNRKNKSYFEAFFHDDYQKYKDKVLELMNNECVCYVNIQNHFFIYSKKRDQVLVLGSCCIKSFNPTKLDMICENCMCKHKNYSINLCTSCRKEKETERRIERKREFEIEKRNEQMKENIIGNYKDIPIYLLNGLYGPFIKYNDINFSVPEWGKTLIIKNIFNIETAIKIIDFKTKNKQA
jgi:hypothetical protein